MKITRKKTIMAGLLCAGLYAIPLLTINGDLFMEPDGLKGESVVPGYEGWIEIDSFQFGAGVGISSPISGKDRESSAPSLSEITVTKQSDSTSVSFFSRLTQGPAFPQVRFVMRDGSGSRIFRFILQDVLVSGYSMSTGGGIPTESLSLNYVILTVEHYAPDGKGGEILTGSATWNIATNSTK